MNIIPIEDGNSNFEKVVIKTSSPNTNPTPHCIEHGAMNKVSVFKEDGGGFWRCSVWEGLCRAGCSEKR